MTHRCIPFGLMLLCCAALLCLNGCKRHGSEELVDALQTPDAASTLDAPESDGAMAADVSMDQPTDETEGDVPDLCTPTGTRCSSDRREVIACLADGRERVTACREGDACFEGACAPVICEPFKVTQCVNVQYEGCNAAGTAEGLFDCPDGFVCVPAGEPGNLGTEDACIARLCEDGDIRCVGGEGDAYWVCNDTGTGYVDRGHRCSDRGHDRFICDDRECKGICDALIGELSSIGCEFWAVDLDNSSDAEGRPFALALTNINDRVSAYVEVFRADGYNASPPAALMTLTIAPKSAEVVTLPPDCYPQGGPTCLTAFLLQGTTQRPEAYRIISDSVPIKAFQFNPLDEPVNLGSTDASLLFPELRWGVRYIVMTRGQQFDADPSYFTIMAGENDGRGAQVTVTPTVATRAGRDARGNLIPAIAAGESQTFTLRPFEVLNLASARSNTFDPQTQRFDHAGDLTGTEVNANGRIAVFGGVACVDVPQTEPRTGTCSHLEAQLPPVNAWGLRYIAAKSWPRGQSRDVWRIMARRDNTVVRTTPDVIGGPRTLSAGEWFDVVSRDSFEVSANRQILVGQFLTGRQDPIDTTDPTRRAGTGDPAFMIVNPTEQYEASHRFFVPHGFDGSYLTITGALMSDLIVRLDGELLETAEILRRGGYRASVSDGLFTLISIPIEPGFHDLEANVPVGVHVYGFSDSGASYAYPAGVRLSEVSQ